MDKQARQWREHLLAVLDGHQHTALSLSGGTDSGTLLAACLTLGGRPPVYSFTLSGGQSADYRISARMAAAHDLPFTSVVIPRPALLADVYTLIRTFATARKTHVQCLHPVWYLAQAMQRDGHTTVLLGTGGVVEDNRKCAILLHQEGEAAARVLRRKNLLQIQGSATEQMHNGFAHFGLRVIEPYAMQPLADYGLSLDMRDINTPQQKGIAFRAFPEFWGQHGVRTNSPMQVNSGVREWHDTLIDDPINVNGYRSVRGIYQQILSETT